MFGLSSVLFIQKISASKEFKLVKRGFEQKIRNTLVKFENRNNFIAIQRKMQVSHSLITVFQ